MRSKPQAIGRSPVHVAVKELLKGCLRLVVLDLQSSWCVLALTKMLVLGFQIRDGLAHGDGLGLSDSLLPEERKADIIQALIRVKPLAPRQQFLCDGNHDVPGTRLWHAV